MVFSLSSFSSFGVCGSRAGGVPVSLAQAVLPVVSAFGSISCGCAKGVDAVARSFASSVFFVGDYGVGRGAYARRSVAFVRALAVSPRPMLLAFPSISCPVGLFPSVLSSRCFCGLGCGTWASVAFAIGLGIPVVVFGVGVGSLPVWSSYGHWESVFVSAMPCFLFVV